MDLGGELFVERSHGLRFGETGFEASFDIEHALDLLVLRHCELFFTNQLFLAVRYRSIDRALAFGLNLFSLDLEKTKAIERIAKVAGLKFDEAPAAHGFGWVIAEQEGGEVLAVGGVLAGK